MTSPRTPQNAIQHIKESEPFMHESQTTFSSEMTRRNWLAGVAATALAGNIAPSAIAPPGTTENQVVPKSVAAIFTAWEKGLHADVLIGKILEGWKQDGGPGPALKLAMSWVEQRLAEEGTTTEQLLLMESQSQAANQLSVGNSISSLRFLDAMDWREFVETLSGVEQILRNDPADVYSDMDFSTRDTYRHVVERVARHSLLTEMEVASLAVNLAMRHKEGYVRLAHVGHYLLDRGLPELERNAEMKVPLKLVLPRLARKYPLATYLGGIGAITAAITCWLLEVALWSDPPVWVLALVVVLGMICASQLAVSVINWLATLLLQPRLLPRFDFSEGIPAAHRTMVAVPTMLTSSRGVDSLLEALEVRYLANRDPNLYFALPTDYCDAAEEHMPGDAALLQQAREGIALLNAKYPEDRPCVFYLFHRPRRWTHLCPVS